MRTSTGSGRLASTPNRFAHIFNDFDLSLRRWHATAATLLALLAVMETRHVQVLAADPVFIKEIELATTHDWFLETPHVYFQCAGEDKKYLTNVIQAHRVYNFSFFESFQPLTVLEAPKCKRCGLYEDDFFTKDDVFDEFELCPLDFSEPPEGRLVWRVPKQMNITFFCKDCNTRNRFAGGVVYSNASDGDTHFLLVFFISMGSAITASILVAWVVYCYKEGIGIFRQRRSEDAKFMELFDQEGDDFFDNEADGDVELAGGTRVDAKAG